MSVGRAATVITLALTLGAAGGPARSDTIPEATEPEASAPQTPEEVEELQERTEQLDGSRVQLVPHVHFGVGGDGEVDYGSLGGRSDMVESWGVGAWIDLPLTRNLALGPLLRAGLWNTEKLQGADFGRHMFLDADVLIRLRAPLFGGGAEAYVSLPVGFSLGVLNDVAGEGIGKGWNIGAFVGLKLFVARTWGIFAEVGWHHHRFYHDVDANDRGEPLAEEREVVVRTQQIGLNVGILLGL